MKIRGLYAGLPGMTTPNPFLPNEGDGTSGGTTGGAGAPPAPPTPPAQPAAGAPAATTPAAVGPHGFPEGVPLEQMSSEQVTNYWKHWAKTNRTALEQRDAELAALKPKAEQYDALAAASRTDQERAIEAARAEAEKAGREAATAEARKTYGAQLVQVRLDAAAAGKGLTPEAMKALAGDGTRFLGADGVDDAALTAFLAALPDKAAASVAPINLGGGRTAPVIGAGIDAGRELYEARKSKPRA